MQNINMSGRFDSKDIITLVSDLADAGFSVLVEQTGGGDYFNITATRSLDPKKERQAERVLEDHGLKSPSVVENNLVDFV